MIFVTLGTQKFKFNRLIDYIYKLGLVFNDEKFIVQNGFSNRIDSQNIKCIDFLNQNEFEFYIKKSRIIICHGGVGSLHTCLSYGKKVISIPRLKRYGEHIDDHQCEICNKYESLGYIMLANDYEELFNDIKSIDDFTPTKLVISSNRINSFLLRYINNERKD